jgi:hypothetical protein
MSGFQSPNYTQTPNDLFDTLLPDMGLAELKVVMCIVRHTFGFHKDKVKLSLRAISRFTGLTVKSVLEGAEQAEVHGLILRLQDGNKTTMWEAIVSVIPTTPPRDTRYNTRVLPATAQLGVKESKEKIKPDMVDMILESAKKGQVVKDAQIAFESAFGFGTLPWDTKLDWQRFSRWITTTHQTDPRAFADYVQWRNAEGKYKGAMTNTAIRRDPQIFMDTGYPTFLAHTAMYGKKNKQEEFTRLL